MSDMQQKLDAIMVGTAEIDDVFFSAKQTPLKSGGTFHVDRVTKGHAVPTATANLNRPSERTVLASSATSKSLGNQCPRP